jgi:lysophospholipase-2
MNMGMPMPSWYDIVGLDERSNEKCAGIQESQIKIRSILQLEHDSTGLPYNRMVLMGFSQGGALSLFTGMQLEQGLGGICILSGYLPCAAQFAIRPGLQDTPILHLHGKMDPLVRHTMAEKSREYVTAKGATNYVLKSYDGLQHTVNMEELREVETFLSKILPQNPEFEIKLKDPKEMSIRELKEVIREAGLTHKVAGLVEKGDYVKLVEDIRNGKL